MDHVKLILSIGLVIAGPLGLVSCTTQTPAGAAVQSQSEPLNTAPRNIILFIADGTGATTWDMTSYWEYGALGRQPYDTWPVKLGMTTQPANTGNAPSNGLITQSPYDMNLAWGTAPSTGVVRDRPSYFTGYDYLKKNATDSAAAATTLATGVKTYNNAIGIDDFGKPLRGITDLAKARGMATGVVTSVPFTHATPAAFGAHNLSRNNYADIGREMINGERLDLIVGTGNPDYDENGASRAPNYEYIGAPEWRALKDGTAPRRLIDDTAALQAMAQGRQLPSGRIIALPKVGSTLQFDRKAGVRAPDSANPSRVAFNPGLPNLSTLTRAALNTLSQNPNGFFVMVEGGAVDWGAHANDTPRTIEELADFNTAVRDTMAWLQEKRLADKTLVIIVTDHGNGMPMGPNSDTVPFQPIENRGKNTLPRVRWHHPSHTVENTRMWATGPGSQFLLTRVKFNDPEFARRIGHNRNGATIDNADIFPAMKAYLEN